MSTKARPFGGAIDPKGLNRRELMMGFAGLALSPRIDHGTGMVAVASEHEVGPYVYNLRGRRHGYDVAKVEAVLDEMRLQVVHYAMDRTSINQALDDGKVDFAFSFSSTPARLAKYIVAAPLHTGRLTFAVRREELKEPFGFPQLAGRRVATINGHSYANAFDNAPDITRVACSSLTLGIRRLAAGRVDAVIGERNALKWQIERQGLAKKVSVSTANIWSGAYLCVFPKKRAELASNFAATLQQMEAAGRFADLKEEYPMVDGGGP